MTKRPFTLAAIALLSLIAVLQLGRVILGWEVTLEGVRIPLWASAVAAVVAAGLALMMWLESRK